MAQLFLLSFKIKTNQCIAQLLISTDNDNSITHFCLLTAKFIFAIYQYNWYNNKIIFFFIWSCYKFLNLQIKDHYWNGARSLCCHRVSSSSGMGNVFVSNVSNKMGEIWGYSFQYFSQFLKSNMQNISDTIANYIDVGLNSIALW